MWIQILMKCFNIILQVLKKSPHILNILHWLLEILELDQIQPFCTGNYHYFFYDVSWHFVIEICFLGVCVALFLDLLKRILYRTVKREIKLFTNSKPWLGKLYIFRKDQRITIFVLLLINDLIKHSYFKVFLLII